VIAVDVRDGVGGKWTCGEWMISGQEANGKGLDTVSGKTIFERGPFKIGLGAGILDRWDEDLVEDKIVQRCTDF
jgi:hypothetical protein